MGRRKRVPVPFWGSPLGYVGKARRMILRIKFGYNFLMLSLKVTQTSASPCSSHLTVRTVPKDVRCAHCFGTGAAKSIHSPSFMAIVGLRFGITLFRRRCRASPEWDFVPHPIGALPPSPLGRCPKPRKPFFEEKGLDPKNLFNYSQLIRNSTSLLQSFQTQTAVFHQSTGLSSPRFHVSP